MAHSLAQVREWNASLKTTRPEIVAVFVGGTSGIGRSTAIKLASATERPTIYIVGRNEAAGTEVVDELKAANGNGSYSFIAADASHLRNVDEVCDKLKSNIGALDLLFLSSGGIAMSKQEGDQKIDVNHILRYYSRMRFIYNLIPILAASKSPRVTSILAAGKEINIEEDNLDLLKKFSFSASNGYPATMTTLAFEVLAAQYPVISFLHVFPGLVATPLLKKSMGSTLGTIVGFLTSPMSMSAAESGEWQCFLSTSSEYPAGNSHLLNYDGKDVTNKALMDQFREKKLQDTVWQHTLDTFNRLLA